MLVRLGPRLDDLAAAVAAHPPIELHGKPVAEAARRLADALAEIGNMRSAPHPARS